IDSQTHALFAVGGAHENLFGHHAIDETLLVAGTNTIAVEVHQANGTSSDLGFDLVLDDSSPFAVSRGPYLQMVGPDRATLRWRTLAPVDTVVRFGLAPGLLANVVVDATSVVDHEVELTGLQPATTYYYEVG